MDESDLLQRKNGEFHKKCSNTHKRSKMKNKNRDSDKNGTCECLIIRDNKAESKCDSFKCLNGINGETENIEGLDNVEIDKGDDIICCDEKENNSSSKDLLTNDNSIKEPSDTNVTSHKSNCNCVECLNTRNGETGNKESFDNAGIDKAEEDISCFDEKESNSSSKDLTNDNSIKEPSDTNVTSHNCSFSQPVFSSIENLNGNSRCHQICLSIICFLTAVTRGYKIEQPAHVCWDETHFGKFANHYLNGTFFFDVHPPLGKMLLALAGWATNYNGTYPFEKPGELYGDHNYVGMRTFCAVLGGLCVPLSYLTVWELTHSLPACILGASFILFDHGCITLSRYILLDPLLMFFVMISVYSLVKFHSWRDCPFSFDWWGWMFCTGYFLACAFSVKWVGLFVILFAGATTASELWEILGDLSLSMAVVLKHLFARVLGLIVVPAMVYLSFFGLHFQYLPLTGTGDGFFSSAFQSTLIGNKLHDASIPSDLAYGAIITLKNNQPSGALLHSHSHLYPKEHPAEQQQITGYSHKDENNNWRVNKNDSIYTDVDKLQYIHDGDVIRLQHVVTGRNLHSHADKAPITTSMYQVTGYGEAGVGDTNDMWRVQVVNRPGKDGIVNTVRTVFRLIHVNIGCGLAQTTHNLPKWGFEQGEMACSPMSTHEGTTWNVEGNVHQQVPVVSVKQLAPSFLESVYESHILMAKTNNAFKPKEGEFHSRPWHWPINYKGQVFSGADFRVYLLGNPVIWWLVLATFAIYVCYYFFIEVRNKRGYEMEPHMKEKSKTVISTCAWLLLGWCLHYIPFYAMGRVLYFHHYFPSYMLSAMLTGILLEHLCLTISLFFADEQLQKKVYYGGISLFMVVTLASFYAFRGLTYGMSGPLADQPNATQAAYKWFHMWEL